MAEEHVVQEKALRSFCEEVLTKLGVPKADAQTVTDVLVVADLRGIESHGVARLGRYVTGLKKGFMKPTDQSRIVKETKATALMDGGQSLGQVVGKRGMDLAIRKARDTAIGVVAVRNSNHYGIAGYYTLMALEHDLMGVSMTNAGPLVDRTPGLRRRAAAQRRPLLPGPRSRGLPAPRRVPAGHGPPRPRAQGQPEGAWPGPHLRARREELRADGEIPPGRDSLGSQGRREPEEDRGRPRRSLVDLRASGDWLRRRIRDTSPGTAGSGRGSTRSR